ncbi:RlmE family RNA methyltransferase [Candidatus Daviesbacteria bacterium]|nr:RlmE family RNA methyltransferase [Candidatus Daviesbacteria bacterium]
MPKPYIVKDKFTIKAKNEGFRARSVYKLFELDQRFNIFKRGMKVLDLGAAPGSWLQLISKSIGPTGFVLGLDLQEIKPIEKNVMTKVCDITNLSQVEKYLNEVNIANPDVIVSDLAPFTTGVKYTDQQRSLELNQVVFEIAKKSLKRGILVMKMFEGPDMPWFIKQLKNYFSLVQTTTVKATRDRSKEMYIICKKV